MLIDSKEIEEAQKAGKLHEAFGVGTAATIAHIVGIGHEGKDYDLPAVETRKFSNKVDQTLRDIRKSRAEDKHGWMMKVV